MYNPQLDTFIRVAEAGSFSKAAQESFITPTAVIKQMNLLESRLGLTLFHRSHQGLSLTRAGRSLLADARHIVQYSQESLARARIAERGHTRGSVAHDAQHAAHEAVAEGEGTLPWHEPASGHV